ncbi:MAG: hypothetical protein QIT35_gp66 [Methanophagales virus PBV299]|uniref:Uncharacterized protein n=1 Tax=Methanophagales virus PBV299 TaxID=2987730 RepID=A0ABY6GLN6_9CAUD|nr:MAG: hypothetical protein QIT35_gp66 [Methanophagales virus PBV299]UYL64862.1 MAG: hypothetical protein OFDIEDLO_00066 [Methanophagales virus PBV299]
MRIRKKVEMARWEGRYSALRGDEIVPTTEVIRKLRRGIVIERATPFRVEEVTQVLKRFGALNDGGRAVMNWEKFVPLEQRRVIMEALQVLPVTGDICLGGDGYE